VQLQKVRSDADKVKYTLEGKLTAVIRETSLINEKLQEARVDNDETRRDLSAKLALREEEKTRLEV